MDRMVNYVLSLFAMLPDKDKHELIALMLSFLAQRENASAQTE